MKNKFLVLLMMFFLSISYSQNYSGRSNQTSNEQFAIEQAIINAGNRNIVTDNNLLITQIGDYNISNLSISSYETSMAITQKGNNNNVDLNLKADKVLGTVRQLGNNNSFQKIDILSKPLVTINVLQNGDNHRILSRGTNSLSEDLKVRQFGEGKTIIINNYR